MTDPQFALQCAIVDIQSQIGQTVTNVQHELTRPFMMVRPALSKDGDHWCFLFGENLQEGVAGFGKTPAEAATAFDKAWWNETIKLHGNRLSSKSSGEPDGLTVSTGPYVADEHGTPITGPSWCATHVRDRTTPNCPACGVGPLEACRGRVPQDDVAQNWELSRQIDALKKVGEQCLRPQQTPTGEGEEQAEFDRGMAFGWKSASGLIQTHRDMQERATARALAAESALAALAHPQQGGERDGWKAVYKPGSKATTPEGCDDCGLNYCHCIADPVAPTSPFKNSEKEA